MASPVEPLTPRGLPTRPQDFNSLAAALGFRIGEKDFDPSTAGDALVERVLAAREASSIGRCVRELSYGGATGSRRRRSMDCGIKPRQQVLLPSPWDAMPNEASSVPQNSSSWEDLPCLPTSANLSMPQQPAPGRGTSATQQPLRAAVSLRDIEVLSSALSGDHRHLSLKDLSIGEAAHGLAPTPVAAVETALVADAGAVPDPASSKALEQALLERQAKRAHRRLDRMMRRMQLLKAATLSESNLEWADLEEEGWGAPNTPGAYESMGKMHRSEPIRTSDGKLSQSARYDYVTKWMEDAAAVEMVPSASAVAAAAAAAGLLAVAGEKEDRPVASVQLVLPQFSPATKGSHVPRTAQKK